MTVAQAVDAYLADAVSRSVEASTLKKLEPISLKPITQLLPSFLLMKADEARTLALHTTVQALASEMAEQSPGSEVVSARLAEVLFIQVLRAHIASGSERDKGWLRAIFDPQIGTALQSSTPRWPISGAMPAQ